MKYKDIITLGRHTLMCGDATSFEDIEALLTSHHAPGIDRTSPPAPLLDRRGEQDSQVPHAKGGFRGVINSKQYHVDLVLTDPPYGINIQGPDGGIHCSRFNLTPSGKHYDSQKHPKMINDDNCQCARDNYNIIKNICGRMIIWGANNFCDVLPCSNGWLVWDKRIRLKNSFSHCELAWTNVVSSTKLYAHEWSGCFREGSTKLNPRPRVHVCQKPVELHMKILEDFTKPGDVILDCFGGSGTTLIACEMTGRTCLMMEISPDYCDVIKTRYETLTAGKIPFEEN